MPPSTRSRTSPRRLSLHQAAQPRAEVQGHIQRLCKKRRLLRKADAVVKAARAAAATAAAGRVRRSRARRPPPSGGRGGDRRRARGAIARAIETHMMRRHEPSGRSRRLAGT